MNGTQPKIEIFEPFGAAYEAMKRILFAPFDLAKWFVIGFAAFLSGAWGGGFHFNFPRKGDWNLRWFSSRHDILPADSHAFWVVPLIVSLSCFILIVSLVLMWVSARGRFVFTDCVVRNRAAIVVPWKEYSREGNSFFLFSVIIGFVALVVVGILALSIGVPLGLFSHNKPAQGLHALGVVAMLFVALIGCAGAVFFAAVTHFMVPIMYRRRCLAREAFFDVMNLMLAQPGPIALYVLFGIVVMLALTIVTTILTCLTCCIAGLPYISSVVFLPAFVWLLCFKLLFLRQFGPQYDVWAGLDVSSPAVPPPPPIVPPPVNPGNSISEPPHEV